MSQDILAETIEGASIATDRWICYPPDPATHSLCCLLFSSSKELDNHEVAGHGHLWCHSCARFCASVDVKEHQANLHWISSIAPAQLSTRFSGSGQPHAYWGCDIRDPGQLEGCNCIFRSSQELRQHQTARHLYFCCPWCNRYVKKDGLL